MSAGKVKVATCQFAVSGSIRRNSNQICSFLRKAKKGRADIVHFPECSLSGYARKDFENLDGYNWDLLGSETEKIKTLAGKLKLWVVLGSIHRLSGQNKPYNCLYLINPDGKVVNRYDKRFCLKGELDFYTPGDRFVTFKVNGVKCALLICFDVRFPELYRKIYKLDVGFILQSFYNARQSGPSVHSSIMRQSMQCRAATNYFWISMSNSSGYYSPYPSCFIQPDGVIVKQLRQNKAGMMINTVDTSREFYDPMVGFRELAIGGKLTNRVRK